MMKLELDMWRELWDRSGRRVLDAWRELPESVEEESDPGLDGSVDESSEGG